MQNIHYLIIGGGIAGTTAAETIRKLDHEHSIAIVSEEPYPLYSRIALSKPNFFLEKLPRDAIWLKTKEWYGTRAIELIIGRAQTLNAKKRTVVLENGEALGYQKLLIATGTLPKLWNVTGSELPDIYRLQTIDEATKIIESAKKSKRAVVIGGGFIAFEMCDMLRTRGLDVSLIMRDSHFWDSILDRTASRIIEDAMKKAGITILREKEILRIEGKATVESIVLASGERVPCELIVVGIGVVPDTSWLLSSGLAVQKGIIANEYLETSVPNVWVAGDAAEFFDVYSGRHILLGNWVNAQMQGMAAGKSMAGRRTAFRMVSSYATIGFGIALVFVGDVQGDMTREILKRGSYESGSYAKIIIENEKIVGAVLINRTADLGVLSKFIRDQKPITEYRGNFEDPNFDIKKLMF